MRVHVPFVHTSGDAVDTRHIARVLPNFRAPADAFDVIVARVWARAQQADPELTALAKKAARL